MGQLTDIQWWKGLFRRQTPEEAARQNELFLHAQLLERNRKFEIFLVEKLLDLEKRALPAPALAIDSPEGEDASPFIIEMPAEEVAPEEPEEPLIVAASLSLASFSSPPTILKTPATPLEAPSPAVSKPVSAAPTSSAQEIPSEAEADNVAIDQAAKTLSPPLPAEQKREAEKKAEAESPPEPQIAPDLEDSPPQKRKAAGLKLIAAQRKSPPETPDAPKSTAKKGLKWVPAAKVETDQSAPPRQRKKGWRIAPANRREQDKDER